MELQGLMVEMGKMVDLVSVVKMDYQEHLEVMDYLANLVLMGDPELLGKMDSLVLKEQRGQEEKMEMMEQRELLVHLD